MLCEIKGVHGGDDGCPIELWRDDDTGRLVIRGYNEAGYAAVDIDAIELATWMGSTEAREHRIFPASVHTQGN